MNKPNRIKSITGGSLVDGSGAGSLDGATVLVEKEIITDGVAL